MSLPTSSLAVNRVAVTWVALICVTVIWASVAATASAGVLDSNGNPDPNEPTFYAWFDAGDGVNGSGTPAAGSSVSQWIDQTGQGHDLTNVSSSTSGRPVYTENVINGHPALSFDGNAYIWGDQGSQFGTMTGGRTIFFAARADTADGGYVFDGSTASKRTAAFTGQTSNPAEWVLYAGSGAVTPGPFVSTGNFQTHTARFDLTSNDHFVDGQLAASGNAPLTDLGGFIVGARYSVNHFFRGDVAEILVYDTVLSDADRAAVEGYLLDKYPPTEVETPPALVDVFQSGDGLYHTYRIPALQVTTAGTLLAFAEGRKTASDHAENDIVLRRSTDNGDSWGPVTVLHDDGTNSLNNPCVVQITQGANTGRILLMYQRYPTGCHESCVVAGNSGPNICRSFLMASDDDGVTWSAPSEITAQVKPPGATSIASGPGVGIQKRRGPNAGRIIFPFNHGPSPNWMVYAIFSDDGGVTWKWGSAADDSLIPGTGNEVQMVELTDGSLMLNSRSNGGTKHRRVAWSTDGGQTWSPLKDETQLIEPQCMASTLRFTDPLDRYDHARVLYAGPNSQTARVKGTLHVSYDEGMTWATQREVYPGAYAYSILGALDDGRVGVFFERDGYQKISLARVTIEWLTGGEDCLSLLYDLDQNGVGCAGSGGFVPQLQLTGCPTPGGSLNVSVDQGLGGSTAFLLLGLQPAAIPMSGGCSLNLTPVLPTLVGPLPLSAGGPGQGAFSFAYDMPNDLVIPSARLQAFIPDAASPSGFSNSNGAGMSVQ